MYEFIHYCCFLLNEITKKEIIYAHNFILHPKNTKYSISNYFSDIFFCTYLFGDYANCVRYCIFCITLVFTHNFYNVCRYYPLLIIIIKIKYLLLTPIQNCIYEIYYYYSLYIKNMLEGGGSNMKWCKYSMLYICWCIRK